MEKKYGKYRESGLWWFSLAHSKPNLIHSLSINMPPTRLLILFFF